MRDLVLRLSLLVIAMAATVRCIFWGATSLRLGVSVFFGLSWAVLSYRKARSIDRERVGLSVRR